MILFRKNEITLRRSIIISGCQRRAAIIKIVRMHGSKLQPYTMVFQICRRFFGCLYPMLTHILFWTGFSTLGILPCLSGQNPLVVCEGSMQRTVKEGNMASACTLNQLPLSPNLYGLGPADSLQGEITLYGGKIYHTTVSANHSKPVLMTKHHTMAAFFVHSEVAAWQKKRTVRSIRSLTDLADSIAQWAPIYGLNPLQPIPFRVKGKVKKIRWHVLKKMPIQAPHNPEVHKTNKFFFEQANRHLDFIGFFAVDKGGMYTHHGARIHMHLVDRKTGITGHVDEASWEKMELYFPVPIQ